MWLNLFFHFSRAVGDRATEPRVAPLKLHPVGENLKEMHLKKIKPKPETKPILQSLKDGLEQLKRSTVREKSQTRQNCRNGFLDRISKFAQGNRSRNPAKKSASFTFAVKPEIAMRCQERYSSLEPETTSHQSHSNSSKQPVQRSASTSVLEMPANVELQPNYSRVRDSLTPVPSLPKLTRTKADDIYAEICENAAAQVQKCPGSHVMARIKIVVKGRDSPMALPTKISNDSRYANSMVTNEQIDSIISTEDEVIYNTIF
ncbi:hypothetical protein ANTQUA_LOCUS2760 [Anthophora quadrimaculata]